MEDMYREKEKAKHTSNEERIYRASERLDEDETVRRELEDRDDFEQS